MHAGNFVESRDSITRFQQKSRSTVSDTPTAVQCVGMQPAAACARYHARTMQDHDAALTASRYAGQLLRELAIRPCRPLVLLPRHPALAWAQCGLMTLTGAAEGPPRLLPLALPSCADGALAALASLAPEPVLENRCGSRLLTERAALSGLRRQGRVSPNGRCRLLHAADGGLALNLARDDDRELLPAWLERADAGDTPIDWDRLACLVGGQPVAALVDRARLLGLAATVAWHGSPGSAAFPARSPLRMPSASPTLTAPAGRLRAPRVLDLSSLWAGPLCSHLLQCLGAEVVKVESLQRPDGARAGEQHFFNLLNAGKRCLALDWYSGSGRARLLELIRRADIVIEASRPRALRQIGIDADALLSERPELTWISLTGYGRDEPMAQWIAYGDDAGVAAGLSACALLAQGQPWIVGDAIADPLAGLHAALAAWAGWLRASLCGRGGGLVSIPLVGVAARCAAFEAPIDAPSLIRRQQEWEDELHRNGTVAMPPQAPPDRGKAAALGADTQAVLADWGVPC